jgi:hypothetical protein
MTMTRSEAARKAGQACAAKYGREHMQAIGRKGFRALCRKFPGNSRRLALHHLNRKGIVKARFIPTQADPDPAAFEQLLDSITQNQEIPF